MITPLLVLLGAAVGAPCRWALDQAVQSRHDSVFPWGTFFINVVGSLALGVLLGATTLGPAPVEVVALAGTGFAGAFTTFSTFAFETVRLFEEGARLVAAVNIVASLAVGLAASLAGWYVAVAVWGT
jgi:fluoride exporter